MKRVLGILALLLLLAACGQAEMEQLPEEGPPSLALPEDASVTSASLSGESLSPDGRFMAVERGQSEPVSSEGVYPAQVSPADTVQIIDADTGEIMWEDFGAYEQSILWSPEGGFAALARTARTWCSVTIIHTKTWASWDFALPDGSSIPEYTFFPYDAPWGVWRNEYILDLTVGRGGDEGPQKHYRYYAWEDGGESSEVTLETLPGDYDFDHDGEPESVELETIGYPGQTEEFPEYYELRVIDKENRVLWEDEAGMAHAGQNSIYALRLDGEDYLLQYVPSMGQGYGSYQYRIFSLDGAGEPAIYRENLVEFDINFGSPLHESFDIPEIAAFLREVHGYLGQAQELVNTVWDEIDLGNVDYSNAAALENALEEYQKEMAETA